MRVTTLFKKTIIVITLICGVISCGSKTKDELYSEGLKQVNKGNLKGAIVFFRNALEKDQNFFDARYQLAMAYTAAGKFEQAEREFKKLARQNPSHSGIKIGLAKLYNSTDKPDMAIKEANEYLSLKPGDPAGLEMLGISYAIKTRPVEAEDYLVRALKSDPERTSAKLELVRIYAKTGKEQKARLLLDEVIRKEPKNSRAYYMLAALEKALGKNDMSLQAYQKIAEINPNDSMALYKIGLINIEMGELGKAEKMADVLEKRFPKRAEGFRLKGITYYYKKNFTAAIAELMNSNKIQPNLEAYYFLGLSLYNRGELENALSQFRKILDYSPNFTRARILSGMILLQQKRIDDSITELNKVIQLDGNNALAHNLLGSAYMSKGMYEEGMKELNRSTEIDPKIIDAYMKKGIFHLSKGKQDEAEIDFKTAVQVAPDMLNTRLILSSYYMRRDNPAKALSTLKDGLNGKKSDAVLYNNMAGIMFVEKKAADALKYLQKAKMTDPAFLASYFNQATYYMAMGDKENALNEYRTILRIDPGNVKAMLNMAGLYELMGRDKEAYSQYTKALETKNPAAFLMLAGYHMKKNEPGKALSVLDDAIKIGPKNSAALEMKGRIYLGERKFKEAIKVFDDLESISPGRGIPLKVNTYVLMNDIPRALEQARRIITLEPNSAYGYIMLASVHESRNDLGRAIDEVKNGIKADVNSLDAYMALGKLYDKNKDTAAAMKAFEDALKKNRDYAPAYFAQGALLEKMGKKKEAVKKLREALAKTENYVPALNNLAFLYADGYGSTQEALKLALTAYKQQPGSPDIMDTLGYALLKNGRGDDARKVLEKASALLPNNPTVMYHLAISYKDLGNRKQAAATLQKALQQGDFPEKNQARVLLVELNNTNSNRRVK
jgi:putative PEP-CTERM system TPR-repeat lipoprotein